MHIPVSTYRLQLNASFTFKDVEQVLPYLQQLGISTIYASPFFRAPAGSTHGYDVADPHSLNPEIGTWGELMQIHQHLQKNKMTWLQDIVPNHMVFAMNNHRLADVLERGPASFYYNWFDIDWQHPDTLLKGRLMVPFLSKPFDECLQAGDINLDFNNSGFVITYASQTFPLSINGYELILSSLDDHRNAKAVSSLLNYLRGQATVDKSLPVWQQDKSSFLNIFLSNEANIAYAKQLAKKINANKDWLQSLLQQQYYRLCWWQDANHRINYRRFFAVNELIAINMADEQVFDDYHKMLHNLYAQKVIHGVRIDHIDGLRDPGRYMNRLRQLFGNKDCYMIVEKILEQHEQLPAQWPIQGTTGYEFCSQVSWLLTNKDGAHQLVEFYRELFPDTPNYKEIIFEKKKLFLQHYMAGEWANLINYVYTLQLVPDAIHRNNLKQALGLFMCCLPVYRLYPNEQPADAATRQIIHSTFEDAFRRSPELEHELQFLQSLWNAKDQSTHKRYLPFLQRLMQYTGPLSAKGVEDTTFYIYNALLAHNEVGDSPDITHFSVKDFHECMLQKQQQFPFSLNATSTHDTKRGEDARIRLNALTWFTNDWKHHVRHWQQMNEAFKTNIHNKPAPGLPDEYFIYQSILAGFPPNAQVTNNFVTRLKDYFIKSVREAKVNSNWQSPDTAYEEAGCAFIESILLAQHGFLENFRPLFEAVKEYAEVFSLSQTLIKITAPGIPDTYQGCELWNLSYVDPDNRLPVDYEIRKNYLQQLADMEKKDRTGLLLFIAGKKDDGLQKLYVTWKSLLCRQQFQALFAKGSYLPLYASEECGIIAWARNHKRQWAIVVAPVSDDILIGQHEEGPFTGISLPLPNGWPVTWTNVFTGETIEAHNNISLNKICNRLPVALLTGEIK